MEIGTLLRLIGGLVLLLLNAFFVATEFGLTRLRQYDREETEGDEGLSLAWEMTHKLEIYLTSCQIGITATSILLGVIAEPAVTSLILNIFPVDSIGSTASHSVSIVLSITIINIVHTIWGEQTPTYLGVERAKTVSRYFARPLYWWTMAIYPLLYLGDQTTKATLALFGISMSRSWLEGEEEEKTTSPSDVKGSIANLLRSEGVPEDRRKEVIKAIEIDEIPVRDILVPREQMACLSPQNSLEENLSVINDQIMSRYPLIGDSPDDIQGMIYAEEMLAYIEDLQTRRMNLEELKRDALTIFPDLPVSILIDRFQQEHQELALVVDREDRVLGLVTLTDALEVIVGSAEDPTDVESHQSFEK